MWAQLAEARAKQIGHCQTYVIVGYSSHILASHPDQRRLAARKSALSIAMLVSYTGVKKECEHLPDFLFT